MYFNLNTKKLIINLIKNSQSINFKKLKIKLNSMMVSKIGCFKNGNKLKKSKILIIMSNKLNQKIDLIKFLKFFFLIKIFRN